MPSDPRLKHGIAVGILLLVGLMWHGFLLTNDGLIWDSWYVQSWLLNKNWAVLNEFFGSVGMPIYGWLYAPFAFAPDIVFAFMLATVSCLLAQAVLTYFLGQRLAGMNPHESLCLALLAQAMPVFTAGQDYIMFFFVFMQTLFLAAALITVRVLEVEGWRHATLRIVAVLLFLASFYNAALLVFYGGFFVLLFLKWWRGCAGAPLASAWKFVCLYPDFLLLPPVAWTLRNKLTPQFGWYETYNNPVENIHLILPSLQSFFQNVIPFHFLQLIQWIAGNPVVTGIIVIGVIGMALRGPRFLTVTRGSVAGWPMFAFGLLLLFLAIFPFAAAGKGFSPRPIGEPSRYTILTALPLAILVFCFLRVIMLPKVGISSKWFAPVCLGLAIALGCQIPPVYVAERAEWIVSRSIMHNVVKNDDIRRSSVVILQGCGLSSEIVYGIYAFASAFGDFSRLVTPTVPQNRRFFTPSEIQLTLYRTTALPNTLNQVNPSGQQTLLEVLRNRDDLSDGSLAWIYLRLRVVGSQEEMSEFLGRLTSLRSGILRPETPLVPGLPDFISRAEKDALASRHFVNEAGLEMVPVSSGVWVAKYETTQGQYQAVTGKNPSLFKDSVRPVECVSWNEAAAFCRILTESEVKGGRLPEGHRYRLPTLQELEKVSQDTPVANAVLAGEQLFWHTEPCGSRPSNPLGLHDIIGNVWEWTDTWADKEQKQKLSFGGSFANTTEQLLPYPRINHSMDFFSRALVRRLFGPTRRDYPDQAFWDRGFRVVLSDASAD